MKLLHPGHTNLRVTPIGLGLAALGRPGYINLNHKADMPSKTDVASMEHHVFNMLDLAYELGIRHFDAARSYGMAEEFLGKWLRRQRFSKNELTVSSKWGYSYTAGWRINVSTHEVKDHSLQQLKRQWDETITHLGDYLDWYQIHSATLESGVLDNKEVLNRLEQIRDAGIAIGLTLSGNNQAEVLEKALRMRSGNRLFFDTVQATYNVLEPSAGEVLYKAHDMGMGVLIKEVLANGRLTAKNQSEAFADKRRVLEEQARRFSTTIDAIAIKFALEKPFVDSVLSGAATADQLRQNLHALEIPWDNTAETAMRSLSEPPEAYWQTRKSLPWN